MLINFRPDRPGELVVLIRDLTSPQILDDFKLTPQTETTKRIIVVVAVTLICLSCYFAMLAMRAIRCKTRPSPALPLHTPRVLQAHLVKSAFQSPEELQ